MIEQGSGCFSAATFAWKQFERWVLHILDRVTS